MSDPLDGGPVGSGPERGGRAGEDPYAPEVAPHQTVDGGAGGGADDGANDSDVVTKTGTTTVGITTDEGVVIATDRRASLGGRFVSNKNVVKVEQVHPTAALTLVGSVGGAQSFVRSLRAEVDLEDARQGEAMSIHALATLAGNFARGGPFRAIHPILGGVDEEGSHVYVIDPAGGVVDDDYSVTGSGMTMAYGAIEGNYEADMSLDDAEQLAARAINAATERDTASGNGLVVATVTDEGVEIEEYDDVDDVLD